MLEQYGAVKQPQRQGCQCCSRRVLFEYRWVVVVVVVVVMVVVLLLMLLAVRPRQLGHAVLAFVSRSCCA